MLKIIVDEINPSIAKGFNNTISDEEKESTEQQITTWSYW
jgi:predicted glycosyltransferase